MAYNNLPKITIESKILLDLEEALKTEWLVTNGLGGYASSTLLGANTRKYHGLLIAAFNPPVDRRVLLAKIDEKIHTGNKEYFLGTSELKGGGFQPEGYRYLADFSLAPLPTATYKVNDEIQLKKTVFMPYGKNATIVIYNLSNLSDGDVLVSGWPLVNSRHFHSVTENDSVTQAFVQKTFDQGLTVQPPSRILSSTLTLISTEGRYKANLGEWVETFFRVDASRGESCVDNSYKPGVFEFDVSSKKDKTFAIVAVGGRNENETQNILSTIYKGSESIGELYSAELKRREDLLNHFQKRYSDVQVEDWLKLLVLATDSFVVNRESTKTKSIIAGYHWFEDWGRDSLISLPGLTLVTGRFEDAKQILLTFKRYRDKGVVPNRFPDSTGDKPIYNTVDATLWYFDCVLQYLKYTNDFKFVHEELWSTLESIIENHLQGTLFNIQMDEDGLVSHGPQLTWMDAAPGGKPVTPREGKAVEIQALWYNALKIMQLLAIRFGEREKAQEYLSIAEKTRKSFIEKFWNPERTCLFDIINDGLRDSSLRPNQIIAVSLDFTMLDNVKASQIVNTVQKRLWGFYGLKTLSDDDPRYRGRYKGDCEQRDNAYHNGTVWPWLLGPFVKAFLKLKNHEAHWRSYASENFLKHLFTEEFYRAGLGSISEIFDGDSPHEPNGCIAQAWSVAEPLRAYVEDVLFKRPPFELGIMGSVAI
jgi:predicted glycogen debranching enzyme